MTKTLLVSATLWELEAFWERYLSSDARVPLTPILSDPLYMGHFTVDKTLDCCITGVGVASVLINLAAAPLETYDWVLGVGFVGSYTEALAVGDVVQVCEDAFADYGLEEETGFVSLANTSFPSIMKEQVFCTASDKTLSLYPIVRSFTKSVATGNMSTPPGLVPQAYDVQVESMESAAFALLCSRRARAYTSLRVVSNYVRPGAAWDIPLAKARLAQAISEVVRGRTARG